MASGLKGSIQPNANTDTTLFTVSGSACVVNISACNSHASNADPIEIYVVPQGSSKGIQHAIEKDVELADKGFIERTGIVLDTGDALWVESANGDVSFNIWGVELS